MKKGYVIPLKEKFSYGIGDTAINIAYGAIGFFLLWFMVNVGGISPAKAGLVFLLARFWDAVSDYIMGRISDRTRTRWGRRRPYILFGALPMGIMFAMLWLTPGATEAIRFVYYLAIFILFNTAYTVVAVPYGALMPEMTQNYDERTSLSGFRMGSSFVGTLIGAAGIPLICWTILSAKKNSESFPVMGGIFGLLIALILFVTATGTRERVKHEEQSYEGLIKTLVSFFKLREFRIVIGMFLFNMIGFDLIMANIMFYLGDVVNINGDLQSIFTAIPLITAVAASPLWVALSAKLGKKRSYIIAAVYFTLAMLTLLFIPPENNLLWVGLACALAGIGISASQIIPWSILPDVIEIDEYRNGVRREGAFYGITTFLYKLASAAAISLSGAVLSVFGYIEAPIEETAKQIIVQPESAVKAVRTMIAAAPGMFFIISAVFVFILPITKESFDAVRKELEERKKSVPKRIP